MARRKAPPKKRPTSYAFHKSKGRHQMVIYFEGPDYKIVKAAAESEQRSVSQFVRVATIQAARAALVVAGNRKRKEWP